MAIKRKSDTKVALKEWIAVHENEVGGKVKAMRSDNGGEFVNASLEADGAWNKTSDNSSSFTAEQWGS